MLESIELMVSELATNCVRHANAGFTLLVKSTKSHVRVEVSDRGGAPRMQFPGPDDPTGRGLRIVEMLSDQWGERHADGKTVWFTAGL